MKTTKIGFTILLIFTLICCNSQKTEWQGTIEEVDGVTIVKNPIEPMYGPEVFSLEEELVIGVAEGAEEHIFSQIRDIAVDEKERTYILDSKENNIKIYKKNGEFVKKFGRQGRGPGEFHFPHSLIVTNQNEISVQNIRNILFFSLEGDYKRTLSITKFMYGTACIDSEGNIIGLEIIDEEDKEINKLKKFDAELNYLSTLWSLSLPSSDLYDFNPFPASLRWDVINGNEIICGYMKEYKLKIFDALGSLRREIFKEFEPVKVAQKDVDERLAGEELPSQLKEGMTIPEFHCPFQDIIADDEGRIYVMTFERIADGKDYYYDVFDAEGKYMAKVQMNVLPKFWKKGKMYCIEEDKEGFQYIKRYKVIWKI